MEHGRIIIDAKAMKQHMSPGSPQLESLDKVFAVSSKEDHGYKDPYSCEFGARLVPPPPLRGAIGLPQEQDDPSETAPTIEVPDNSLPYCVATVRGYNLVSKKWGELQHD